MRRLRSASSKQGLGGGGEPQMTRMGPRRETDALSCFLS